MNDLFWFFDCYLTMFCMVSEISNPLYVAFSYFKNGRKILETSKKNREQIQIFNGFKTISMAWIIAGHSFNVWYQYTVINREITLHVGVTLKWFFYIIIQEITNEFLTSEQFHRFSASIWKQTCVIFYFRLQLI